MFQLTAVIDSLQHPDAATLVDIDVGGIFEHRLSRPQSRFEPVGSLEVMRGLLGRLLGKQEKCGTNQKESGFHHGSFHMINDLSAAKVRPPRPAIPDSRKYGTRPVRRTEAGDTTRRRSKCRGPCRISPPAIHHAAPAARYRASRSAPYMPGPRWS